MSTHLRKEHFLKFIKNMLRGIKCDSSEKAECVNTIRSMLVLYNKMLKNGMLSIEDELASLNDFLLKSGFLCIFMDMMIWK